MSPKLKSGVLKTTRKKENRTVYSWPELPQEKLFLTRDNNLIWKKYCGFLDLSIDEFMAIQRHLLTEQIELTMNSKLGRDIVGEKKPGSITEFRKIVPLTTYQDYHEYLGKKNDACLSVQTCVWTNSSGTTGTVKWVPYSLNAVNSLANDTISALILSSASKKGEVLLSQGDKIAIDFLPASINRIIRQALYQKLTYRPVSPKEDLDSLDIDQRNRKIITSALENGIDYLGALPVMLAKTCDQIGRMEEELASFLKCRPFAMLRALRAIIGSKRKHKPVLPRDVWRIKGLICGGAESELYREKIYSGWGVRPLEVYLSTETSFMAMQGWNKKGLTLLPHSQFYEFIPESELQKCENDRYYQPSTVLLNELEENRIYEIVVTNFHGGPFLRYRIGDLIRVVSLKDEEMQVKLPQIVFFNRTENSFEQDRMQF